MNLAAVILCGGTSRRMGGDKASLPFGEETMLARVVRLLSGVVPPERIVCVAAAGQTLPPLPDAMRIARDRQPDWGPMEGLAVGLAAVAGDADLAFVTTCDAPLLQPQIAPQLALLATGHDAVVPKLAGQWHPLTAVYRPQLHTTLDERIASGERRVVDFVESIQARTVEGNELRKIDPLLWSFRNCNTEEEYRTLLNIKTS